ncbi:MAG: Rieske 2Fe-2S family protein [Parvicella sp.]
MSDTSDEFGVSLERTLPSSWYLQQSVYQLEREHIFMREWFCVEREERVPEPGDHCVIEVCGESILLVRNTSGQLNAFYNVCRHRGAQLCAAEPQTSGDQNVVLKGGVIAKNRIVCPYHAWRYDLDGQLLSAPHMSEESGFKAQKVSLYSVACETWGGFVFMNLSPESAPLFSDHIASISERFKRYPIADLKSSEVISYTVNANWKVLCENYNECYHCGPVHPELCKIVPAFKDAGGANLDWDKGVPHRAGATTFTLTGTTDRRPFPGLNEDERKHHNGDLLYPNLFLSLAADHVAAFILRPVSVSETQVDCYFLFEQHEAQKATFNPSDAIDFWDLVNRQDWAICERVQSGMGARVHQQGLFSPLEDWSLDIREYVKSRIGKFLESKPSSTP